MKHFFFRRAFAWSEQADSWLLFLRNKGKSFQAIANLIGATSKDTVRNRYNKITVTAKSPQPLARTNLWTKDEDEQLRALWSKTLSARQISISIGRTRNAVIGRANRLKLPPRAVSRFSKKPKSGRPYFQKSPELRSKQDAFIKDFKRALAVMERASLSSGVSFEDLEPHHCRFIAGDPLKGGVYCGQPKKEKSSFCPEHHALCFKSAKKSKKNFLLHALGVA